jgi:hypothetical protein
MLIRLKQSDREGVLGAYFILGRNDSNDMPAEFGDIINDSLHAGMHNESLAQFRKLGGQALNERHGIGSRGTDAGTTLASIQ